MKKIVSRSAVALFAFAITLAGCAKTKMNRQLHRHHHQLQHRNLHRRLEARSNQVNDTASRYST